MQYYLDSVENKVNIFTFPLFVFWEYHVLNKIKAVGLITFVQNLWVGIEFCAVTT